MTIMWSDENRWIPNDIAWSYLTYLHYFQAGLKSESIFTQTGFQPKLDSKVYPTIAWT